MSRPDKTRDNYTDSDCLEEKKLLRYIIAQAAHDLKPLSDDYGFAFPPPTNEDTWNAKNFFAGIDNDSFRAWCYFAELDADAVLKSIKINRGFDASEYRLNPEPKPPYELSPDEKLAVIRRGEIEALVKDGLTQKEIAKILNISICCVSKGCKRLGIRAKKQPATLRPNPRRDERIKEMRLQGWDHKRIAKELGVVSSTVSNACKKLGI